MRAGCPAGTASAGPAAAVVVAAAVAVAAPAVLAGCRPRPDTPPVPRVEPAVTAGLTAPTGVPGDPEARRRGPAPGQGAAEAERVGATVERRGEVTDARTQAAAETAEAGAAVERRGRAVDRSAPTPEHAAPSPARAAAASRRPPAAPAFGPRAAPVAVAGVPFVAQRERGCGPAALAMVLGFWGEPVALDELTARLVRPGLDGTLGLDLLLEARRRGYEARQLRGDLETLRATLAAGRPLLVFLDVGPAAWAPRWHFAVAIGLDAEAVTLHSAETPALRLPVERFLAAWARTDYWALDIRKPA